MISISRLYCNISSPSDRLRYARRRPGAVRRPVVVWNATRACNLRCRHCYAAADARPAPGELDRREARAMIRDLADFGVPVLLFSGGEPLLRPDLPDLIAFARDCGLRPVLSTNGVLITAATARALKAAGTGYVGISLDGPAEENDRFRGVPGAFERALAGLRACREAGLKTGLRFTMHKRNRAALPAIFDLVEREGIPRVCFYHLVYTGRARHLRREALSAGETREALDLILDRTAALARGPHPPEVLTVDNHADGPWIYLRLQRAGDPRAAEVLELLRRSGGNSSGAGIGCIDWEGNVHPDQFWRSVVFGNVRERPFSRIWSAPSQPLARQLRERQRYVTGRCAACRFLDACGGNMRVRAEAVTGDPWAPDPGCYLTDEEIGAGGAAGRVGLSGAKGAVDS